MTANSKAILAIDIGSTTGWALKGAGGGIVSGSLDLRGGRFEGGGMRFLRFKAWLAEIHAVTPVGYVAFEEVRAHKGTDAAHIYGGLMAQLMVFCEEHAIPYQGVPVQTIKKFMTGKGNAGKPEMKAAARSHGFSPADDNEADAIGLMLWQLDQPESKTLLQ